MKVFIENEAGSDQKNLYNEKTLEYKKTFKVSKKYPCPYGFVLNTTSEDGDNIDCFVITKQRLKTGQIVECNPIGLMEQMETSWDPSKINIEEKDHNILAVLKNEKIEINDNIKEELRDFVLHAFDYLPKKKVNVGNFLDKEAAIRLIEKYKDKI